jgi:hypothetical protein
MKAEKLVEILSAAGYPPRHLFYRAREHEVLAFVTDDVVAAVAEIVGGIEDDDLAFELIEELHHTATEEYHDEGTAVYFPRIGYS